MNAWIRLLLPADTIQGYPEEYEIPKTTKVLDMTGAGSEDFGWMFSADTCEDDAY